MKFGFAERASVKDPDKALVRKTGPCFWMDMS